MTRTVGHAVVLLTLLAGSAASAQTQPWPSDPQPPQQQTAPWPSSPPPARQASPFPDPAPQGQQLAAPWPASAPPSQGAAISAPPPGAAQGPPPACMAQFMGHREKVEKSAALAKAASERKATREEMCKHVTAYFKAEVQWIKFTKDQGAKCGIPPEIAKQIQTVHVNTGKIRKQLCSAGPGGGPAAAPTLSDALGTTTLPAPETTRTGRGTLDTLTGNALRR